MAEVNVASVVEKLEGSLVKTRDQGLEDLRRLLGSSRSGSKLQALSEDGFHTILEAIYRIIRADRTAYLTQLGGGKSTVASANRLTSAATALRLTVEAGCPRLKHKSVLSVLDHIISTLPTAEETFVEPLRSDYLKCFKIVLEHGPHSEHFRPKKWQELVDFVLAGLAISISDDNVDSTNASMRNNSTRSAISVSFRTSQTSTQKKSRNAAGHAVDDLLGSLRALSAITNMPLLSRAPEICDTVVDCLMTVPRAQETALETFNNVAFVLLSENLSLLQANLESLFRIYRHFWTSKSTSALREQVLVSLYSLRPLLLADSTALVTIDLESTQQLLSTLVTEYSGRSTKDMLQFDDIALRLSTQSSAEFPSYEFVPIADSGGAITNWTLLEVVAAGLTGIYPKQQDQHEDTGMNDLPRKRRRVEAPVHDTITQALKTRGGQNLAALHILIFLMSTSSQVMDEIKSRVTEFASLLLEEDHNVSNWAMLFFTKLCWLPKSPRFISYGTWKLLFEAARRSLSTSARSRAGCMLVDAILQHSVQDTGLDMYTLQEMFVLGGRHGPAVFTDAALLMFTTALTSKPLHEEPVFEAAAMRMFEWLNAFWVLPESLNRAHNASLAFHAQPELLTRLLATTVGLDLQLLITYHRGEPLPLARSRAVVDEIEPFISYLECTGGNSKKEGGLGQKRIFVRQLSSEVLFRLQSNISELLHNKMKDFEQAWEGYVSGRLTSPSNDIAAAMTSVFAVSRVGASVMLPQGALATTVNESALHLWKIIEKSLQDVTEDSSRLTIVTTKILRMRDNHATTCFPIAKAFSPSTGFLARAIGRSKYGNGDEEGWDSDIEMMESMESRTSHRSKVLQDVSEPGVSRRDIPADATSRTYLPSLRLDLLVESAKAASADAVNAQKTSNIINEMVAMDAQDLVNARFSILDFLNLPPSIGRPDAAKLLQAMAAKLLTEHDFERNEVALCFLTKVMARLAPMWTNADEDDDLTSYAADIYDWLIGTAIEKDVASPSLKVNIASLLDMAPQLPSSIAGDDLPSPRTSLLGLLKQSPNLVKFKISPLLVSLFNRYVLTQHEAIFTDIVGNLPSDLDNLEGVAVRFYLLADLGAKWSTILRQATYHLFETAVNVPKLQGLGYLCIGKMSTALGLPNSRKLFELFAPQILYTWLGSGTLAELPYAVFQYNSATHLISENESEITAQIALWGGGKLAEQLVSFQGSSWRAALEKHFAHAEAYCLASQISLPESEQLFPNAETRLRKEIRSDIYAQKIRAEVPAIVGHLFRALQVQDDRGIDRAFEKSGLRQPLADWKYISQLSTSNLGLPTGQQPFFRAKYLTEELQWLCSQAGHMVDELWSPSVLVYLYRTLLVAADPAIGPLHACSVLRTIKVIVVMGGPNALTGYPIEMLLHIIRPYLTMFQCSEDAIVIYWYLLEKGKEYLSARPSFVAGLAISIFAALSTFVRSPQDSTTQESHFVATMENAQKFSGWLGQHLIGLQLQDESHTAMFQNIVSHVKEIGAPGSNAASSHEGAVLMCLLKDQAAPLSMLTEPHFDLAVRSLCKDFVLTTDAGDDILASPEQCLHYVGVIKKLLDRTSLNEQFRMWAAQIIGRACSVGGPETRTSDPKIGPQDDFDSNSTETASHATILKCLEAALWQDNTQVAASAEQTLQAIASKSDNSRSAAMTTLRDNYPLLKELQRGAFVCPVPSLSEIKDAPVPTLEGWQHANDFRTWCSNLAVSLCSQMKSDPILEFLGPFAFTCPSVAPSLIPYAVHLVLSGKQSGAHGAREKLSGIFAHVFASNAFDKISPVLLQTVLYLRRCKVSTESTLAHRNLWLDIDFNCAAEAAVRCHSWCTALLCVEIGQAQQHLQATRSSRRSTQSSTNTLPGCLTMIYQNVDDPDFFYAATHDADMQSVIKRLAHESASQRMLSFQSAVFDSMMRSERPFDDVRKTAMTTADALSAANMQSISQAVRSFESGVSPSTTTDGSSRVRSTHRMWNVTTPNETMKIASAMNYLGTLATAMDVGTVIHDIERGLLDGANDLAGSGATLAKQTKILLPLAILSEIKDLLTMGKTHGIDSFFGQMSKISDWAQRLDFKDLSNYLDCRESALGMIRRNDRILEALGVTKSKALIYEAKTICQSLQIVAHHESSQFQLSRAAYLSELAKSASKMEVCMEAFSQYYLAKTISNHGEISASVDILRELRASATVCEKDLTISTSEVLAELGQQVSAARLEPPDEIIDHYLMPAYKELKGQTIGSNASRVFHLFATFCDTQLQDPSNRDDYARALERRAVKMAEVHDLEKQFKKAEGNVKQSIRVYLDRAKSWFKIYDEEYQQKAANRDALILRCLENYLRSMTASDDFPNDKLRFLAIWLDAAETANANGIVSQHIRAVPSWKFATLVNQLVSRLSDMREDFQEILTDLMFRISSDHPYHSLYQLFAVSKSKNADADEAAALRQSAAAKLTQTILKKSTSSGLWVAIHNCSINFVRVAQAKLPEKRSKFTLGQLGYGDKLISSVEESSRKIPPPAMHIDIRVDKNYSQLPVMVELQSQVSIAGGVSAPKIVTAIASDGSLHKMLLKAGNDDLRQDSIMEQVFEEVSSLLSDHRSTRQRKLGIRTYKVVPLVTNAGIIEFVQGTIPLHDYLLPAHERYFPKDYNRKRCRNDIHDAAKKPVQQRIQAYRNVTANFHPVMRFFFMENFLDPDEWFYKRLNYSRSTAAISILGHVLGLGDRHGHNILLDRHTGEVVHIDLGVAFEAGRILPVPEVVPFRLTRDLVDGMGISGVEGVFRRCCNFTLEALRADQESIMTLLDVLRYDPLVSWSISPGRLKKMQEMADASQTEGMDGAVTEGPRTSDEPNEANRALTVVREKLGKSLSVEAEVNQLIRQATDEKNLAVLFAGWGAYA